MKQEMKVHTPQSMNHSVYSLGLQFKIPLWKLMYDDSYSEKPSKMQQCIKILLFLILNKAQHVSGDTPPIIRSLELTSSLWVCIRGRLSEVMMGGVSPETC
jgi:hypothetical protein